ncbi:metal ABC transporter permease [Blochmannia endosymbiont of Polyrhachis (Hedomyrma) turneri]|uniref:metal ABC transporter permease n=1 Tax=Blochmannia endosymbiont of Polyrhachis (Hedomyrma) turneri TaxID=1505596 RepID=UPI00061A84F0|nr:metal ABC transporter permease [Blochmannia endosymbiont of Polyrhachis (Hedomyrma) turneri]AKC59635.1 ABC transport system, permease component [Blochmannia endosymbiont of Polyrhachis (Hedomyrma) turneri]
MFDIFVLLFDPFICHGFMRRALVACCALSLSSTPIGVFLLLRHMTLIGDALSHSILPGVAIGYFFFGESVIAMGFGGLISGVLVSIFSGWISLKNVLREEASFAAVYLMFLSFGVILVSVHGSNLDLLDLLFGSVFSINVAQIRFIGIVSTITFFSLSIFYRALVIETFNSTFLQCCSVQYFQYIHMLFLLLVVLNLVASFQVIGTLMSVGLMIFPSLSVCYWTCNLLTMLCMSVCIAILSSLIGLLSAFYMLLPPGPVIVLCNSIFFLLSMLFGRYRHVVVF